MSTAKLNIIYYADFAVSITESENDLQTIVFQSNESCILFSMDISIKKTKMMTITAEHVQRRTVVSDEIFKWNSNMVFSYLYLLVTTSV